MNWKNLRSPTRATFKNPKISLSIGKNLEVQPKSNFQKKKKKRNFESIDELGKFMS